MSILQAKGGGQKLRTDEPCELVSACLQSRVALEAQKGRKTALAAYPYTLGLTVVVNITKLSLHGACV